MVKTTTERYSRSRLLTVLGIITTIMLCVFISEKIFLPQSEMDLSMIDGVIFLGIGLSLSVAMARYSYQAWSLDSRDFMEWYFSQQIVSLGENWLRKWYAHFPEGHLRSLYRFIAPLSFLAGIAIAGFGLMLLAERLFAA